VPISPMLPPRPDRFGSIRQAACWLPCCSMAVAIHFQRIFNLHHADPAIAPASTMARASWTIG